MIRWSATVRSEADRLEGIRIETRIDDLEADSFVDSVEPSDMHVEEVAPTHPRNIARVLRFPRPLAGGEVQSFVYTRRFRKLKPLKSEDVFAARPYAPTDKISMRLVFDGWMPDSVHYRETDRADSVLLEQERVIPDELTSEVRREIDSPSTSLTYGFFWQYNRHT